MVPDMKLLGVSERVSPERAAEVHEWYVRGNPAMVVWRTRALIVLEDEWYAFIRWDAESGRPDAASEQCAITKIPALATLDDGSWSPVIIQEDNTPALIRPSFVRYITDTNDEVITDVVVVGADIDMLYRGRLDGETRSALRRHRAG